MLSSQSVLANLQNDSFLRPTLSFGRHARQTSDCWTSTVGSQTGSGCPARRWNWPSAVRVYDDAVHNWQRKSLSEPSLTTVVYEGLELDLSTAAYADDLVRVEAATAISEVEHRTVEHTKALKEVLRPHRLALNLSKSGSLVAARGRGAYADAARAFGGAWTGPPIKQSVKYLGAHIDAQLSLRLEITKRIAAARNSFSLSRSTTSQDSGFQSCHQ